MTTPLVLCYHGISDSWPNAMAVGAAQLERQLLLLLHRGYTPATFTRAVLAPPGDLTLAVTFDDGLRSVYHRAFPVLARLEIPATIFVPTGHFAGPRAMSWRGIDHWHGTPHEDELRPMDWDQLHELALAGWEIGSHTCSHPRLTRIDDDALRHELEHSREVVEERLELRCSSIAYPFGDHDERVVAAAADAGYAAGATLPRALDPVVAPGSPLTVRRIGVYRRDGDVRFRAKTSRPARALAAAARRPSSS